MNISEQKKENYTIVSLDGRLDTTNYQELEKSLGALTDNGSKMLILNCEKLDYISSSGLRIFLMFLKKIKSVDGKFYICSLQDAIKEIFQISGFTSIFDIFDDLAAAENAMV